MLKQFIAIAMVLLFTVSAVTLPHARIRAEDMPTDKTRDAVMLYVNSPIAYVNNAKKRIDPTNTSVVPLIIDSRTLVPLRFISEAFGAEINWDDNAKTAAVKKDGKTVTMVIGQKEMRVDGETVLMDTAAIIMNGRTYVPLRALSETLGKEAFYERGLIIISGTKDIFDPQTDKTQINQIISLLNNLPTVGTAAKFKELAGSEYDGAISGGATFQLMREEAAINDAAPVPAAAEKEIAADTAAGTSPQDFSQTNVQVQGVDEADEIKTDGEYIYLVRNNQISVVKAVPANSMSEDFTLTYDYEDMTPMEMYIDGESMVVIGSSSKQLHVDKNYWNYVPVVKAVEYDISDRKNIEKVREINTDGSYISSRKVGENIYIATQLYAYNLFYADNFIQPVFRDTAVSDQEVKILYEDMRYFPDTQDKSILTVMGFAVGQPEQEAHVNTYFGGGSSLYMSKDNLYVATQAYGEQGMHTNVYKFALDNGSVTYQYQASLKGSVLNQFSMDEHNGYFRIATTSAEAPEWRNSNNLYILSETLDLTGKIENIAPDERIYSVRFMGDKAYMVTFRSVDPLFAIDVKDPANPKIIGALKIPGYSDYLHPYDENHLIGFGKDTTEDKGAVLAQGMKIAMFDVTDMTSPKQMFSTKIGGRGTDSPLLTNHKALLFDKARGFMAFPVQEMTEATENGTNAWEWGQFAFQGAYVFDVDLEKGFTLKGKISHLSEEDMLKAGLYSADYNLLVKRIVSIGDTLYTASNGLLKSTRLGDMKDEGQVAFKNDEPQNMIQPYLAIE